MVRSQQVDLLTVSDQLIQNYIQIGSENEVNVSAATRDKILKGQDNKDTNPEALLQALERAQNEVLLILAMDALPRFLLSDIFKAWREKEIENGFAAVALVNSLENKELAIDGDSSNTEITTVGIPPTVSLTPMQRAFSALDPIELPRISKSRYLSTFLASVESLPISVSIASASKERRGFPLIYVNAIFSEITGYDRMDIIGRNCSFLQRGKSERKSIDLMVDALSDAKPIKVCIVTFTYYLCSIAP